MESPTRTLPDRPALAPETVVWRVDSEAYERSSSPTGWTARFVPYLRASILADLLDDWVGPENWVDEYAEGTLAGKTVLWCHLSVRVGDEWITKSDVGVAPPEKRGSGGDGMAEKGAVSDAFKRAACLKWGLGREVYEMESLWAPVTSKQRNGKNVAYPTKETDPALVGQLKELGFGIESVATDADEPASDPDPTPEQPAEKPAAKPDPEPQSEGNGAAPDAAADSLFETITGMVADGRTNSSKVLVAARRVAKEMSYDEPPRSYDDIPAAMGPKGVMALIESLTGDDE